MPSRSLPIRPYSFGLSWPHFPSAYFCPFWGYSHNFFPPGFGNIPPCWSIQVSSDVCCSCSCNWRIDFTSFLLDWIWIGWFWVRLKFITLNWYRESDLHACFFLVAAEKCSSFSESGCCWIERYWAAIDGVTILCFFPLALALLVFLSFHPALLPHPAYRI